MGAGHPDRDTRAGLAGDTGRDNDEVAAPREHKLDPPALPPASFILLLCLGHWAGEGLAPSLLPLGKEEKKYPQPCLSLTPHTGLTNPYFSNRNGYKYELVGEIVFLSLFFPSQKASKTWKINV